MVLRILLRSVVAINMTTPRQLCTKTAVVKGMVQSDVKLDGKTVVITGCNTGIGYETALDLAGRGARVIMACRNVEKAEDAKKNILKEVSDAELVVKKLDVASLESVRSFAKDINETERQVNILINNAGVMMCPASKTKDGFEMQMGTNHIGHFLLTNLLLDLIKKSAPSRIVIVSSTAYKRGRLNWDDIMQEKRYDTIGAYGASKLANVFHCTELSKKLQGTGVTCNCLHPGVINTELGRHLEEGSHLPWLMRFGLWIFSPIIKWVLLTPKQGAQTTIYCAIAPELDEVSGKYFASCAPEELLSHAKNQDDAEKLWKMSEEWTNKKAKDSANSQ